MKLPLPVSSFASFLPHRSTAVWVDEVLSADAESGVCRVRYSSQANYAKKDSILESAYIEWMAQSFGYITAAQYKLGLLKNEGELEEAFLAAVRNFNILEIPTNLKEGDLFEIKMKATHRVGPVTMVDGQVQKDGKTLATANLKLFAIPKPL